MKPHEPRPPVAGRRFSFCSSAGLLLLVSACSTLGPPSDLGPASEATEPDVAVASEEPETRRATGASGERHLPTSAGKRNVGTSARRMTLPSRSPAGVSDDPPADAGMDRSDATLQGLINGEDAEADIAKAPIAGPVPKVEPLATQANRPYRLRGRKYRPMTELKPFKQRGVASWYGKPFHGRRTATGERYNMHSMSAAHPTLPLPSYVKVTNLRNGTSVIVRVNDRGPFAHDRIIDLSQAAARELGIVKGGLAAVELNLIVPDPAGTQMPAPIADVSK